MAGCFSCVGGCRRPWLSGISSSGIPSSERSSIDVDRLPSQTDYRSDIAAAESDDSMCRSTKSLRASICLKLTMFVGLLVVLASGVPALVLWLKAHEQLVKEIERRLITVSTLRQEQLRDYLLSETDKAELIGTRVIINNYLLNASANNKSLAEFDLISAVGVISDFKYAAIYDTEGQLALTTADDGIFDRTIHPTDIDSIRMAGFKIDYPVLTHLGWMYNVSRAIYKKQMLIGVLLTWVNATKLVSLVYDRTGLQATGELLIGVPESMNMVHLLFPPLQNPNLTLVYKGGAMARAINGESGIMTLHDYSGAKVIAAYRPVGFMHWGLLAKLDIHEAYAPVRNVRIVIIITIVVLVSVGVMASLGLAKVFTSPIVELGRAAVALGQGNMTTRVRKGSVLLRDEIADLKDIFNSMAHQIASHQLILEHKVRERTSDLAHANEGLGKEIEERRRIELELEKAKDVAIAANRSKSEFLANMSHEIRTPLNAIINFTELCLDTQITPEQQEHLDYVRFAAQHLLRLITDILDFSKIEAGKLEIEEIQFSLFDQLEHAVSVLAARAFKNGLELCCSFDADVPDQIMGDPGRLLQIFVNLIGNGIKFTKKGEVVVSVSVKHKTLDTVELLFTVKDTGLGIPENKRPLLFQAFSQVDSSTQRLYGGTGLGLVISFKLAVAMGGSMWVDSDGIEGHGSTFLFTAKFHIPPSCSMPFSPRVDMFKDVLGLVVDDNETSRRILVDLLKNWGMVADSVGSVEAALSAVERAAESGQKYNVVLLDMWLNGTDSSELISVLRARPTLLGKFCVSAPILPKESGDPLERTCEELSSQSEDLGNGTLMEDNSNQASSSSKHNVSGYNFLVKLKKGVPGSLHTDGKVDEQSSQNCTPVSYALGRHSTHNSDYVPSSIIMLTSVNHTDATRCKELGINNHVSKPIKRSLLVRVLQSALGTQDKPSILEGKASKGSESPAKSLNILVAEDNVVNQRVAVILLQKWGHTAVLARNGAEAVEQATKEAFDLILMDVQMPLCDGFEATAKIRELEKSQKKNSRIPIVAMTAHAMSGDGERCIAAGMDFYISKPLNAKKLQELLQGVATGSLKGHSSDSSSRPLV